jgi:hypothetical protein
MRAVPDCAALHPGYGGCGRDGADKDSLTIRNRRLTTYCGLDARVVCLFPSTGSQKKTKIDRIAALGVIVLDLAICRIV